jgi:hypothetical protein
MLPGILGRTRFMGYLNSNLAREVGRLADWREKVWSKRYQAIVVSTEEARRSTASARFLRTETAPETVQSFSTGATCLHIKSSVTLRLAPRSITVQLHLVQLDE